MANETLYFDGSASSPIARGQLNADFFQQFVTDFGSHKINQDLWPATTLLSFIVEMEKEKKDLDDSSKKKMANKLIKEYKNIYNQLVNN